MALSVSSFPEVIHVPPPEDDLEYLPESNIFPKRRRLFGGLFGKEGTSIFGGSRHRRSATDNSSRIVYQIDEEDGPVLSISAHSSSDNILDLSSPPRKTKPALPALTVPSPNGLTVVNESQPPELIFPPTPTATDARHANPMKESIRALRLSRIHGRIDWARKLEDEALPPWVSRGAIASLGDQEQNPVHDDKNRISAGTTVSSAWSASTRSPSSRTSSMYWGTATTATSATSPSSLKSRGGFLHTPSEQAYPSRSFRPMSASSERSAKTTASSPGQLSGTDAMRFRTMSTASDPKAKGSTKVPIVLAPFTGSAPHKRSRTLSNPSNILPTDKGKGKAKVVPSPTQVPFPESPRPRQRARTLSNSSIKGKGKAKPPRSTSKPLQIDTHPPVPRLPLASLTSTSTSYRQDNPTTSRPSSSRGRSDSRPRVISQSKSAPTTPDRKAAELPTREQPPLPTPLSISIPDQPKASSSSVLVLSPSPTLSQPLPPSLPTVSQRPRPPRRPSGPVPPRSLPIPPRLNSAPGPIAGPSGINRSLSPSPPGAPTLPLLTPSPALSPDWQTSMDVLSAGISTPSVWGPPGPGNMGWDTLTIAGGSSRSSSRTRDHSADSRTELVVVATTRDAGSSAIWQERDVGDVITQLRGLKMR
ncbi:hypothetical protein BV25DRAFT_220821 [Artomyces pyxidatus]|uniref:Uncharacterized protein n=1 Tax=Artomyces pyxidatus TaxID=48021 RepID=A0ACB8T952_9AGAM|nr:hypothetical protein BV25DRAFT_220821 [Artomyces pyxidatus]